MSTGTVDFELSEDVDGRAVVGVIAEHVRVAVGRTQMADRVLLDTLDSRLRGAGLRAE